VYIVPKSQAYPSTCAFGRSNYHRTRSRHHYGWYYNPSSDPVMRDRELRDMVEHGFNSVTAIKPVARATVR